MCGIIGAASATPIRQQAWLIRGRDALVHRGPDDAGEWQSSDGCVVFGHRRLSILDLSNTGSQPMQDQTGDLCIVFNGEIYNFRELREELTSKGHKFRSASDTEVLLLAYREWGASCLERLNGMFAFAIYDRRQRRVFAARDRAGEKPFFYSLRGDCFRFASELKGLMADPNFDRQIDPRALDLYLGHGFVPGGLCMLKGTNKLAPAHGLIFDLESNSLRTWRYWSIPPNSSAGLGDEDLESEFEGLLQDAVARQLVADVPVGILLSGGIDSSLVTAMAARSSAKVKTFTIRFPGHDRFDETHHARLIARHFGTCHTELEAEATNVDLLPLLAKQFDEPIVDSSVIPTYLVSRMVRRECKVALGGDGGDELFGGYIHYNRLLWIHAHLDWLPSFVRRGIARASGAFLPIGTPGRKWLQTLDVDLSVALPPMNVCFDRGARRELLARPGLESAANSPLPNAKTPEDLLHRALRWDFQNYLAEDILVKVDRASMLNSLEVRAPLLDHRIIEFAFGRLPSAMKATTDARKVFLKKLTSRILPPEFDRHRKQGFSIPLSAWLKSGPWLAFFRDVLLGSSDRFFEERMVHRLLDAQRRGASNGERLFALVFFELWRKEYRVSI